MAQTSILLAVGAHGLELTIPENVQLCPVPRPVQGGEHIDAARQKAIVKAALDSPANGPSLSELAKGKRRAAILVGDIAWPAPYEIALSPVIQTLLEAEIRPTRIALLAVPGDCGPVLGRAAIHRYGEEFVGEHEFRAWLPDGEGRLAPLFETADLRIAIAPVIHTLNASSSLPEGVKADFYLGLRLGRKPRIEIVSAAAGRQGAAAVRCSLPPLEPADVFLTSGGGGDWETTLEEALLSFHLLNSPAQSAVLAFSGEEGLGSARFTRDLWALLEQAEEVLASGKRLTVPAAEVFDPAMTLACALSRYLCTVLFSPNLSAHSDFVDFAERLGECPHLSEHLALCGAQAELWPLLAGFHGSGYSVSAEPLGWRAAAGSPEE